MTTPIRPTEAPRPAPSPWVRRAEAHTLPAQRDPRITERETASDIIRRTMPPVRDCNV